MTTIDLDTIDRLHNQVMAKYAQAGQDYAAPYWEGHCDALDWVLQRLDDIREQATVTVADPTNVFVSYDGDTHWLACFAADPDAAHGTPIHPIDVGDTWAELAAKVEAHDCTTECGVTP